MFASKFASKKAVVLAVIGAFVVAGAAFAYWTAGGTGTGTASTGSTTPLVVKQTVVLDAMYPGKAAQTLSGNFNNANNGPIYVGTVTPSFGSVAQATGATGTCDSSDYDVSGSATVGVQVPSGTGVGAWSGGTIRFINKAAVNQDGCKGATVTLNYLIG